MKLLKRSHTTMTTAEIEKLIISFDAAAIAVDKLVKSTNEIVETNRELKAAIDTKAYLEYTQGDILQNLRQQNILYKSLIYLIETDEELLDDIVERAKKHEDKEVASFWLKRVKHVK